MARKRIFRGVGGLSIMVVGDQDLINAFKVLGENAVLGLSEPSIAAANVILTRAKSLVPVDDGDLLRSLKVYKPGKRAARSYKMIARVSFGKGGAHGVPLELGHRLISHSGEFIGYVQARPFLRPAADESKLEVSAIMSKAMSDIIREVSGI